MQDGAVEKKKKRFPSMENKQCIVQDAAVLCENVHIPAITRDLFRVECKSVFRWNLYHCPYY